MPDSSQPTAVFDIIGTCPSLEKPRLALAKLGAPEHVLELWFAHSLRDSFAFSHAGGYAPLGEVLRAKLARMAAHAWDIAGASRAVEGSYLDINPTSVAAGASPGSKPDVVAGSLLEAAQAMAQR